MSVEKKFKLVADTKDAIKDIEKVKKETKEVEQSALDAADSFGAFGVTVGGVRGLFSGVMKTAKMMFSSIKVGLISTGIGAFVVALGTMAQYFKDNEEGASKFRQITSQLGVVLGNITDIISDFGGALVKLFSKDLKGFRDGIKDAIDGVKNFGKTTQEEMKMAKNLEKERAALIIFERDANVSKAKSEAEIMKLRMKARDEEAFTNEQRLEFMRQANKLADDQLQKDLHIAKKKLEFQQIENSYSKSSTENLNAEAQLEAQLFNIQRSNFSERKRMKSEEQVIVKRIAAEKTKEEKDEEARLQKQKETAEKELEILRTGSLNQQELEIDQAKQKYDKLIELSKKYGFDTTAITDKHNAQVLAINKKYAEEEEKVEELTQEAKLAMASKGIGMAMQLFGEESKAGKALAVGQALINTYSAAAAALAPPPTGAGPIFGPIAAVGAVAAGLANVKKIVATKLPGAEGGGDSIGARPDTGNVPELPAQGLGNLIPNTSNFDATTIGTPPVQAYVVENDISNSQALQEELEVQATL
tara:strand:- start:180 stop:1775 length:1596 start_codon:yes stop_codon:yes gene_type:complete